MSDEKREWLVRKGGYFYRPNGAGYTTRKIEAGRYTKAEAVLEAAVEPLHMTVLHESEIPDEPAISAPPASGWRSAMTELDKDALDAAKLVREEINAAFAGCPKYPACLKEADGWRPIETAPKDGSLYEVSQSGNIRVDGTLLHPYRTDKGYLRITLGGKSVPVHRLVAIAFIANPRKCVEINHLDGNKSNNSADNLEWCTRSENMKHAYASGLHSGVALHGQDNPRFGLTGNKHAQSKPVRATFGDGTTKDYESQSLVAVDGYKPHKVNDCINGRRKSHGGATWRPLPSPPKEG